MSRARRNSMGKKETDRCTSQKPCGALDQHPRAPPCTPSTTPHTRPHAPPCSGKIFWLRLTQPNQKPRGTDSHAPTHTNAPPTTSETHPTTVYVSQTRERRKPAAVAKHMHLLHVRLVPILGDVNREKCGPITILAGTLPNAQVEAKSLRK